MTKDTRTAGCIVLDSFGTDATPGTKHLNFCSSQQLIWFPSRHLQLALGEDLDILGN